ncbi:MAG: beta-lactamase [Verrucomicrobiales bacterium]|nr:beta-lactamase [Verrucomicrobiales bacterium]
MKRTFQALLTFVVITCTNCVRRPEIATASHGGKEPARILGIKRLEETTLRLGGTGDNWHMTWTADDQQLAGLCDGLGWPPLPQKFYNSRLFKVAGNPPDITFDDLPTYPDIVNKGKTGDAFLYYGFGILAIDDHIYQFLSTPNKPFFEPATRFVGAKLIYSEDKEGTWHNQDGSTPVRCESWETRNKKDFVFFEEPGDAFSLLTVLQMGKNYEENTDGYIYVYSPNGSREGTMNQLVMFRVPKTRLLEKAAYEFFVGRNADGSARWSTHMQQRGVVHTFPSGWVNTQPNPYAWHPSVVYIASLRQYLMVNWGMGADSSGTWFGKPSYLGFWTAPHPWGPWKQIHEERAWMPAKDPKARAYQPQISPKWISPDGRSFYLVWTDYQEDKKSGKPFDRPYYGFNVQKVKIIAE